MLLPHSQNPSGERRAQHAPACRLAPLKLAGAATMANVKSLNDMKEENDDDKRQAYYAGGQGQNGGGRCAGLAPPLRLSGCGARSQTLWPSPQAPFRLADPLAIAPSPI